MKHNIISALYKKEIQDILRDKKTILMMIIVPLIIYPLMFAGSMLLASNLASETTEKTYTIGFQNVDDMQTLRSELNDAALEKEYHFAFREEEITNIEEALTSGYIDAAIVFDSNLAKNVEDGTVDGIVDEIKGGEMKDAYRIYYSSAENDSNNASSMLADVMKIRQRVKRDELLTSYGFNPEDFESPFLYKLENIDSSEKTIGSLFGYIIPFLLITTILMGAMYPAIDTTAGEKERGTLETLMTLPVSSLELITSKFLATSMIAIGAAFLNVLSMGFLGAYFYSSFKVSGVMEEGFRVSSYIPAIAITLLCAVVFAMFASAVSLAVCIFAKSFKEAQNLSTPLMLVFLLAAMVGMFPNVHLEGSLLYIPVVNITLLIGELFAFKMVGAHIMAVLVSNVAYCGIAVVIMARLFHSEEILFGDSAGGVRLIEKRSEMKKGQMPGIGDLILLFSLVLIVVLMIGSWAILNFGYVGLFIEQALLFLLPVAYGIYMKADMKKLFSLSAPKPLTILGDIILFVGALLANLIISGLLTNLFPGSAEAVNSDYEFILGNVNFVGAIFLMGLLPAVCEEFVFRGFMLGTLKHKFKPAVAVFLTGFIFAIYHLSLIKILPITVLGTILAYVCYKTKSIVHSIMIHFCNNATAVVLMYQEEKIRTVLPFLFEQTVSGENFLAMIFVMIASLILGIWLINVSSENVK